MSVVFTFFFLSSCVSSAAGGAVKVKPGDDATLPCRAPRAADITLLEWSRLDLGAGGYVFFYRNDRPYESYQAPSFRGRVELRDESSMRDGDVSVVLKNVTVRDSGTYECLVTISKMENNERTLRESSSLVNLTVTDSGHTAGHREEGGDEERGGKEGGDEDEAKSDGYVGVVAGVSVSAVVLVVVVVVGWLLGNQRKGSTEHRSYHPAKKSGPQQL
ncbi:uncharacterized protein [Trachinotus anak]|uniref:uncharacterized protein isoform X4 n=1 Tax=Trachinotus anak TaxID=443729 RepID=UPI0039F210AA